MEEKIPIVAVVGPTASGKTDLAVQLAKKYHGEVISADSMQIYKGLDIATAKPTAEEMDGIPHHLIDLLPLTTPFSVADFMELAKPIIADVHQRGKLPILCGGTGLYVQSLLTNVQLSDAVHDEALREKLRTIAAEQGAEALHKILAEKDPQAAAEIHPNNLVRVIRAIEVYETTGKTQTQWKAESHSIPSPYQSVIIGLQYPNREDLYNRINLRVEQMVARGMVEEARQVWEHENPVTAYHAIGYKELIPYFEKKASLEECIAVIQQETRRYAKRQMTWFRKMEGVMWINLEQNINKLEILKKSEKIIANSLIL